VLSLNNSCKLRIDEMRFEPLAKTTSSSLLADAVLIPAVDDGDDDDDEPVLLPELPPLP